MIPQPKHHLYFKVFEATKDHPHTFKLISVNTHAHAQQDTAAAWVQYTLSQPHLTSSWLNERTLRITTTLNPLRKMYIFDENLEDLVEAAATTTPTIDLPPNQKRYLDKVAAFHNTQPDDPPNPAPTPTKTSSAPTKTKTTKKTKPPSHETYETVAAIAARLSVTPNKARQLLRKANIKKPDNGWQFEINSDLHKQVEKILSPS